jgi:hypothetical protein
MERFRFRVIGEGLGGRGVPVGVESACTGRYERELRGWDGVSGDSDSCEGRVEVLIVVIVMMVGR